jgi:hypothetical protein
MAVPVWQLEVNLTTKSAVFTTGMADAAKAARGSFADIKDSAADMGRSTSGSMLEARHATTLLAEEFGVHLPRGLTMFISSLGPVAGAMEAAFPYLAIIAGITLLIEHLDKMKSAAQEVGEKAAAWQKLKDASEEYGDSLRVTNERLKQELNLLNGGMTNSLAMALKEAAVQADQLAGHLQEDLDKAMKLVEGQQVGLWSRILGQEGSSDITEKLRSDFDAAKQAIEQGKEQIRQASESGNASSVQSAETSARVNAQKNYGNMIVWVGQQLDKANSEQQKFHDQAAAVANATMDSVGEISGAYSDQTKRIAILKGALSALHQEYDNATLAFSNEQLTIKIAGVKEAQSQIINLIGLVSPYTAMRKKMAEADEKSDEERMKLESGLTRYFAEEYQKQIEQQHQASSLANAEAAKDAAARRAISQVSTVSQTSSFLISKQEEQAQLRKILETEQRDLISAHQSEIAEQQSFITQMRAQAEGATNPDDRSKDLAAAAEAQTRLTAATRQFNEEMARTKAAIQASDMETAKLNNSWAVFFRQSNQELLSLTATINGQLQTAMHQFTDGMAQGLAKAAVEGKSFGKSMEGVAREMSESMIEGLIKWGMQDVITKMGMKATAASLAGANATASMALAPWPVDMGAPAFGATMMGTAMAFEAGGIVPGVGKGDIVPARLEPGEGILNNRVMDGLKAVAAGNGSAGGKEVHIHNHFSPQIHAVDSEGVDRMLREHGNTFVRHYVAHARRMNQ